MLKKQYVKSRKIAKVTFEVAKEEIPEGVVARSVHLVGDFNNWDTEATPMKRTKGGVFRVMLELEPGREYKFRYLVNREHWFNDWHADAYGTNDYGEDNCIVATPASAGEN
jgi:hypothetical protein